MDYVDMFVSCCDLMENRDDFWDTLANKRRAICSIVRLQLVCDVSMRTVQADLNKRFAQIDAMFDSNVPKFERIEATL